MTTTFTLSAPNLEPLVLSDLGSVRSYEWAPGAPRPVTQDAPGADGEIDTTRLHGGGSVTFGIRVPRSDVTFETTLRRVRAFTNGRLRPTLTITENGSPEMFAVLSRGTVTAPRGRPTHQDAVIQFSVPYGIFESTELRSATASASGETVDGRQYSLEFDREYPASAPRGAVEVVNAGDRDAYPVLRLYGPWSDESAIINDTTGDRLVFDGLSVTAGNYLEIDVRRKTILLNGDAAQTRYSNLVYPDSTWWTLWPGAQRIRFVPTTFNAPAQAQILWRDAYS